MVTHFGVGYLKLADVELDPGQYEPYRHNSDLAVV
jgi:hypothetical protein